MAVAPFAVTWEELDLDQLRAFFAEAGEEGVTWEAKADDARDRLRPDSIRKAACGLANRVGGCVIVGARFNKEDSRWELPGIESPDDEPELWFGKAVRR